MSAGQATGVPGGVSAASTVARISAGARSVWAGALGAMGVMMSGHVLMPLFMLGAMLWRREEYVGHC